MNVVICWSNISGYMASCWRKLSGRKNVNLFILAFKPDSKSNAVFDAGIMNGLQHRLLDLRTRDDPKGLHRIVSEQSPDVLIISGWFHKPYRKLALHSDFKSVLRILSMDTNLKLNLRQFIGKYWLRSYVKAFDYAFVPGERSWQMARFLGFERHKICRGAYGLDYDSFSPLLQDRIQLPESWPKRFLFVGQYISRKGLGFLLQAYRHYREIVTDPWPLYCCGKGPMSNDLRKAKGVVDLGFIQSADLPDVMLRSGVFVLPSRFDAWGVALVEACAAGLPIICTEECGASVEVVRSLYNGVVVASENVRSLVNALVWMHENYSELPSMGACSQEFAKPFASEYWADRVAELCH